jgi:hypothetical protein
MFLNYRELLIILMQITFIIYKGHIEEIEKYKERNDRTFNIS